MASRNDMTDDDLREGLREYNIDMVITDTTRDIAIKALERNNRSHLMWKSGSATNSPVNKSHLKSKSDSATNRPVNKSHLKTSDRQDTYTRHPQNPSTKRPTNQMRNRQPTEVSAPFHNLSLRETELRPRFNDLSLDIFTDGVGVFSQDDYEAYTSNSVVGSGCMLQGLNILSQGTTGKTNLELKKRGFMEIMSNFPKNSRGYVYATVLAYRSGNLVVNKAFLKKIKDMGTPLLLFNRERDTLSTLNRQVEVETEGNIRQILNKNELAQTSAAFLLKTMTTFRGEWERNFNKPPTMEKFYTKDNGTIEVEMMNCDNRQLWVSTLEKELTSTIVKFMYKDDKGSFVVLMPNAVLSRFELQTFIKNIDFERLVNSFYCEISDGQCMPKFQFETKMDVSHTLGNVRHLEPFVNQDICEDLTAILGDKHANHHPGFEQIQYKICTEIIIDEFGTSTKTEFNTLAYDCATSHREVLINKPFAFFILDQNEYIMSSGVFLGQA